MEEFAKTLTPLWDSILNQTIGLLPEAAWKIASDSLTVHFQRDDRFATVQVQCGEEENPPNMTAQNKFRAKVWTTDWLVINANVRYFLFGDWSDLPTTVERTKPSSSDANQLGESLRT